MHGRFGDTAWLGQPRKMATHGHLDGAGISDTLDLDLVWSDLMAILTMPEHRHGYRHGERMAFVSLSYLAFWHSCIGG